MFGHPTVAFDVSWECSLDQLASELDSFLPLGTYALVPNGPAGGNHLVLVYTDSILALEALKEYRKLHKI